MNYGLLMQFSLSFDPLQQQLQEYFLDLVHDWIHAKCSQGRHIAPCETQCSSCSHKKSPNINDQLFYNALSEFRSEECVILEKHL